MTTSAEVIAAAHTYKEIPTPDNADALCDAALAWETDQQSALRALHVTTIRRHQTLLDQMDDAVGDVDES